MLQLIYTSAATVQFSQKQLKELLHKARQNNESLGVSGMLVYNEGSFLQILEGEEESLTALYEKIEKDERHDNVKLLLRKEIEERSFGEWKMGFFDASRSAEKLEGFSDFFRADIPFDEDDADRAKSVLMQFREGQWRQAVSVAE